MARLRLGFAPSPTGSASPLDCSASNWLGLPKKSLTPTGSAQLPTSSARRSYASCSGPQTSCEPCDTIPDPSTIIEMMFRSYSCHLKMYSVEKCGVLKTSQMGSWKWVCNLASFLRVLGNGFATSHRMPGHVPGNYVFRFYPCYERLCALTVVCKYRLDTRR